MSNMQSNACIGKTYPEIWQLFRDAHKGDPITEAELREMHLKWVRIAAEVNRIPMYTKKK